MDDSKQSIAGEELDFVEEMIEYYYNELSPENQALADQDIYVLPELPSDLMTPSP